MKLDLNFLKNMILEERQSRKKQYLREGVFGDYSKGRSDRGMTPADIDARIAAVQSKLGIETGNVGKPQDVKTFGGSGTAPIPGEATTTMAPAAGNAARDATKDLINKFTTAEKKEAAADSIIIFIATPPFGNVKAGEKIENIILKDFENFGSILTGPGGFDANDLKGLGHNYALTNVINTIFPAGVGTTLNDEQEESYTMLLDIVRELLGQDKVQELEDEMGVKPLAALPPESAGTSPTDTMIGAYD